MSVAPFPLQHVDQIAVIEPAAGGIHLFDK
jgi:hypothetical protein